MSESLLDFSDFFLLFFIIGGVGLMSLLKSSAAAVKLITMKYQKTGNQTVWVKPWSLRRIMG
jgi:hypothetical protein